MFGKRKKRREAIRNKLREKSEYKMKSENVAIPEIHTKILMRLRNILMK